MHQRILVIYLMLLSVWSNSHTFAQNTIDSIHNSMRMGDVLCAINSDYIEPGTSGDNACWQLGVANDRSETVLRGIVSRGDTISVLERGCISHFLMRNDTLYSKGEQSRRAFRLLDKQRPIVRFPFSYGDSIYCDYAGTGVEENLNVEVRGTGYTIADGKGVMTYEEDTLDNVLRLHLYDDYYEKYEESVELHFQKHRYLWYCLGHRYPIMESRKTLLVEESKIMAVDSLTLVYLPTSQSSLLDDAANDSILSMLTNKSFPSQTEGMKSPDVGNVNAMLTDDGMQIRLEYSVLSKSNIRIWASDIMGNNLCYASYPAKEVGDYQECLVFKRKPIGNVLILNVSCNNTIVLQKIFKN